MHALTDQQAVDMGERSVNESCTSSLSEVLGRCLFCTYTTSALQFSKQLFWNSFTNRFANAGFTEGRRCAGPRGEPHLLRKLAMNCHGEGGGWLPSEEVGHSSRMFCQELEKNCSELRITGKRKERRKELKILSPIWLKSEINQQLYSSLREGHSPNPAPRMNTESLSEISNCISVTGIKICRCR